MNPESEFFSHAEFDLSGEGEGGFFRVDMHNQEGELNRNVMLSKGNKFVATATLLEVVHGKWKDGGGDDATLLIASFRFIPSAEKRFQNARIDWTFTSDDPAIDVVVADIAPDASWISDPVTLKLERTLGLKGNLGATFTPASAGLEASYEGKEAKDLQYHTSVDGSIRMENKQEGGYNSARWVLKENPGDPRGICRMLQVAVLLKRIVLKGQTPGPRPTQTFNSVMKIAVDKGRWPSTEAKRDIQESAWKKTPRDEPVIYHPDEPRESGDFEIDKNDLHTTRLTDDIMYMSMHEAFEDLKKERQAKKKAKEVEEERKKQEEVEAKRILDAGNKEPGQSSPEIKAPAVAERNGMTEHQTPIQQGGRAVPMQIPAWAYVILGILVMYVFQQLVKS